MKFTTEIHRSTQNYRRSVPPASSPRSVAEVHHHDILLIPIALLDRPQIVCFYLAVFVPNPRTPEITRPFHEVTVAGTYDYTTLINFTLALPEEQVTSGHGDWKTHEVCQFNWPRTLRRPFVEVKDVLGEMRAQVPKRSVITFSCVVPLLLKPQRSAYWKLSTQLGVEFSIHKG